MKSIRAHVFIFGRVQGVFFRANTLEKARELGLTGWVRNIRTGEVEAVFEGGEKKVKKMLEWCKKGPPASRVDKIETKLYEYKGEFDNFQIK